MHHLTTERVRSTVRKLLAEYEKLPITHKPNTEHYRIHTSLKGVLTVLQDRGLDEEVAYVLCPVGLNYQTIYTIITTAQRRLASDERFCYHAGSRNRD